MILNVFIYIYIMCIYIHSTFYVYYMLYSVLKFSIFLRCVRFLHWIESPDSSFFVIWGIVRSQDSRGHQWWLRLTVFKSTSSRSPSPKKITKWYQVFKVTKKQLEMGKWKNIYAFWTCPFSKYFCLPFPPSFFSNRRCSWCRRIQMKRDGGGGRLNGRCLPWPLPERFNEK